ncbi:MAG: hypothetical protein M3548_08710 [Actinomycetota bacterium]|nr:hypothetical protein [Actinomycetota bacterium]
MNADDTTKLLTLVAAEGSPGMREVARDVLEGRHTLRDLAYLSSGETPGIMSLLDRWEQTSERERAALADGADEAMSRIVDNIRQAEVAEPTPPPEVRQSRSEADDETYFTQNEWFRGADRDHF